MMNQTAVRRALALGSVAFLLSVSFVSGQTTVPSYSVRVRVLDDTGGVAGGTTVMFTDTSNYARQGLTTVAADLPMYLPSGIYQVKLSNPGYPVQYYNVPVNSAVPMRWVSIGSDTLFVVTLTRTPSQSGASYGKVSGFVQDSTGKPLVNVKVSVTQFSTGIISGGMNTDSAGHFSVSVPAMPHTIMVYAPPYPPQYWTPTGTTLDPKNNTTVQVMANDSTMVGLVKMSMHPTPGSTGSTTPPQHLVRVRVLDESGVVATGCTVMFIDTGNYVRQGLTTAAADLSMPLPSSPYQVKFVFPGYPDQYYDTPINSDWPQGRIFVSSDTLLIFSLTRTPQKIVSNYGTVSGFVLDSMGKPVNRANVTLIQIGTSAVSAGMMTDSAGYFFATVPDMPHRILVNAPLYPPQYWTPTGTTIDPLNNTTLQIMANDSMRVVIKLSLHPGSGNVYTPPYTQYANGFIMGTVLVKSTNLPATGLRVIAVPRDTTIPNSRLYVDQYSAPYSDTVKADGTYRISNLPRGPYWVYTRGGAFIAQFYPQTDYSDSCVSIGVDTNGRSGINFSIRAGGTISGQLTSTVIANLDTIMVNANLNGAALHQWALTTSGGRFVINGLVAGSWNLSIDQTNGYFIDNGAGKTSEVTVEEGKTVLGVFLQVTRGGFVSGLLSPPVSADSVNRGLFDVALYPDSVLNSSNQFPYEIQTTWGSATSPATYISGTISAGTYRIMFRPYAPYIPRIDTIKFVACRSFSMAGIGPIPSLLQSPQFQVVAGDTAPNVAARFGPGFSFLARFGLEGGDRPNWAHVDACIKDGNQYVAVCHGFVTAGDTVFQLTGLLDEKDYYLRCEADGYPPQWWSPSGTMSTAPSTPYHFSTLNFVRPDIKMTKVPSGYYSNYTPFWVNTFFDSTNRLTVQWNIDMSTPVDSFFLYSKDRAGIVTLLTKTPFVSGQTQYVWRETRDLSSNQYSYVVVGKGTQYSIRSSTAGYDYNSGTPVPADSLWLSVQGDKNGISMTWTAGKTYTANDRDSIALLKRTGTTGAWSEISRQWSRNTWLSDNQWDKVADVGKTLYYKIELVSAGTVRKWSGIRSITIDTAFVNHLSNHLAVGPNEQYKKIQDAVDVARDNDQIDVSPGTYFENINLKGKVLDINGNWTSGGVVPVIDAAGGTAITIPYPSKGISANGININGLKIQNALSGINASTDVNVNQCLFVNVVKQVLSATIDSASMVRAAAADPFNQYNVQMNAWQCTFIGGSGAGSVARVGSQGTYEASTGSLSAVLTNPAMMAPATSFSSSVSVNNSILANFNATGIPLDMFGSRGHANFSNCDFWNTSDLVTATYQNQITMDKTMFKQDPKFIDTVMYFLPDSSPLRTLASNMSGIGYDDRRLNNSGNGSSGSGPRPAAVQNFRFAIAGPHAVRLTWSPLAADQNSVRYVIYRVYGYDSLWYVNQSQWSLKVSQSNMSSGADSFLTKDTVYVDTTPKLNVPYVYVVAGVGSNGNMGDVKLPFPPPLSAYVVTLGSVARVGDMKANALSFSAACLTWPSSGRGRSYRVYRMGLASVPSTQPDTAAIRKLIQTHGYESLDSFATRDTVFIDSAVAYGKPYCFVVASADSAVMNLPLEQMPFSSSYLCVGPQTFASAKATRCTAQTWTMVGPWGNGTMNFSNATGSAIFHWDDLKLEDKLYSHYVPATEMKSGAGYWFMAQADTVLTVDTGLVAALSTVVTQKIVVSKGATGWNQVSSMLPYPVSPSWLSGFTTFQWNPDSNQYVAASVIQPWKAYWVWTDRDTTLPLSGFPATGSLAKKTSAVQWELRVTLSGKKCRDGGNFCGVVSPDRATTMRLSSPKPPQAFNYPQLFFMPPQTASKQTLSRLYKSQSSSASRQEWTYGVSPSGENMTIAVDGIAGIPQKAFVFAVQNNVIYNLRNKAAIPVAAHKETVYGYIVVTSDSREMALYSGIVELRKAYPNPFRRSASIEYTIPYAFAANGAKIEGENRATSLDIYNIAGRRITTLVSGVQPVGFYKKVWFGTNDAGSTVASGYYVVRLSGLQFQKTTALFKVR